ncbi:FecR family protein [Thermomonas sp.]|uniref:FecR family protein n=1 Tax=Thermomonas sp. TaxID=1971895 RepID=UPI003D0B30C5
MAANSATIEATAADWLARCDGGHWSAQDAAALQDWLDADTAHRVAFLRLQAAWQESARLQALGAGRGARREQMLQALMAPPLRRAPHRPRRWPWAVAAALAGCTLAAGWLWRPAPQPQPVTGHAYQSGIGQVRQLVLADGSRVTLAAASRIEVQLTPRARRVHLLEGEAIFAVARDPARPFAVIAHGYRAVAVGTRFSVRRDPGSVRVVVTEGRVRLEDAAGTGGASALLPAGSLALARADGVLVRRLALEDAQHLLDWQQGWLVFRDTPLSEVVAEFNRYNTRRLVLADERVGALRIGGSFRWDNEAGFVRLLEAGFPIRAESVDGQILLHAR